jgi:hypothetical protein
MLVLLVAVEVVACGYLDSFGGSIIFYSLLFVSLFFGTFGVIYVLNAFGALTNDWLADVERMEWTTPVYWSWLYQKRRREWSANVTIIAAGFASFIGAFLCYGLFSSENSSIGFFVAFILLMVEALCWYKGFWKPRTESPRLQIPPSVEAEWSDKRL